DVLGHGGQLGGWQVSAGERGEGLGVRVGGYGHRRLLAGGTAGGSVPTGMMARKPNDLSENATGFSANPDRKGGGGVKRRDKQSERLRQWPRRLAPPPPLRSGFANSLQ